MTVLIVSLCYITLEYTKKKSIAYNFTLTVYFNILLYEILLFMRHIIFKYTYE